MEQSLEISAFTKKHIEALNYYVNNSNDRFTEARKFANKLGLIQNPYECNRVSFTPSISDNLENITEEQIVYFNTFFKCVHYPFFINENVEFVPVDSEKFNNIELHTLILLKLFNEKGIAFEGKINCETDQGNFIIEFDHRNFTVSEFINENKKETFDTELLDDVWKY